MDKRSSETSPASSPPSAGDHMTAEPDSSATPLDMNHPKRSEGLATSPKEGNASADHALATTDFGKAISKNVGHEDLNENEKKVPSNVYADSAGMGAAVSKRDVNLPKAFSPARSHSSAIWDDDDPRFLAPGKVVGGDDWDKFESKKDRDCSEDGVGHGDEVKNSSAIGHEPDDHSTVAHQQEALDEANPRNIVPKESSTDVEPRTFTLPYRPRGLSQVLSHQREVTTDEVDHLQQRRKEIEAQLTVDPEKHDQEQEVKPEQEPSEPATAVGPSLEHLQAHAAAVPIGEGVAVVNLEKLSEMISPALPTPEKCPGPANTPVSDNGGFFRKSAPKSSVPATPTPIEKGFASREDTRDSMIEIHPSPNADRRVSFVDPTSVVQETPFTKTLKYFKEFKSDATKNKENSPFKPRRKASLPEEIAALQNEAAEFFSDNDEDLDKYREKDLAPIDWVMETQNAGDIIVGPSARPKAFNIGIGKSNVDVLMSEMACPRSIKWEHVENGDAYDELTVLANPIPEGIKLEIVKEGDEGEQFTTEEFDAENMQVVKYVEHPGIVNAIAMMPKVVFWSVCGVLERGVEEALGHIF